MATRPQIHIPAVRSEAEKALGIVQRASPINFSLTGDIRKRYTDFLVFEIRKDGSVVHLKDFIENTPRVASQQVRSHSHMPRDQRFPRMVPPPGIPPRAPPRAPPPGYPLTRGPNQPTMSSTPKELPKPAPKDQAPPTIQLISDEDRKLLMGLVSGFADKLIAFDKAVQAKELLTGDKRQVELDPITDRDLRSKIHQEIRRIFSGRLETVASSTGVITATATRSTANRGNRGARGGNGNNNAGPAGPGRRDNRGGDQGYAQLGGDYLHFTLYKENKDTMDAINTIARLLKIKASNFGFAGTKDRRAGTVQRVSVYRQRANNLTWINTRLPNVKVGDFSYHDEPLQLGQHGGNEFIITIKNCHNLGDAGCSIQQQARMVQESVEFALAHIKEHGYINYFGLQRFGTYTIGTHMLGMKLLNEDFAGAVDDILFVNDQYLQEVLDHVPQNNRDDYHRAKAVTTWKLTGNAAKALELMPKRFSSEIALIRHLARAQNDFLGALLGITRGMRMMYIHAYQSYVWNFVATFRWSKYGPDVVEGDLVLAAGRLEEDVMDIDVAGDEDEDRFYAEARALTAEDVASGKYTIFDVVLPTPGYDVMYPQNDVGDYYVSFMAKPENGGLNPYEMRRANKAFSLSGNYRHLIGRFIGEPQYALRLYSNDNDQMHPTDLDLCNGRKAAARAAAKTEGIATTKPAAAEANATARPVAAHWAHFSQNPEWHDDQIREDRRRKASQEPPPGDVVTNEVWVQTGLDGSAKRVKITRERKTETQTCDATDRSDETMTDAQVSEVKLPDPTSTVQQYFFSNPEPTYVGVIGQERGQEHAHKAAANIVDLNDSTGWLGIMERDLPSLTAKITNLSNPSSPKTNSLSSSSSPKSSVAKRTAGPMGSGTNVNSERYSTGNVANGNGKQPSADNVANGIGEKHSAEAIAVPKFYSPSSNPIVRMNGKVDETQPGADKIAVVLKFQLKSSNYATVVLRELMGANASVHA